MPFSRFLQHARFPGRPVLAGLLWLCLLFSSCIPPASAGETGEATALPSPTATQYTMATPAPTIAPPQVLNEPPELAELTHSAKLPPVYIRMPDSPKVVPVAGEIGSYGGEWRMVIQPSGDERQFIRTVAYEPLVRWTSDWRGLEPNVVSEYSVNKLATEFTLTLRRGVRWSDGVPFTTADIRFWYEEVLLREELTPQVPIWLKSSNKAAKFEFVDEYTFKVRFASSNSLFLQQLATPEALVITAFPAHYMQKFLPEYADPEELARRIAEGKYRDWVDLFIHQVGINSTDNGSFNDPDRPRLSAWVLETPYRAGAETVRWQRNPYYWKVDPRGNQLPYIDTVVFKVVDNLDEAVTLAVNGEIDMQNLHSLGMDFDSLAGEKQRDAFARYSLIDGSNNLMVINLNQTHQDPVKSEIFQNKNFRIGLSYAINRQEILDLLFGGKGTPWQAAPRDGSPFYDPQMGVMYTEYNIEKANEYLDRAGYLMDATGSRLGPDGFPIAFAIEVLESQPQQIAMLNLVSKYWSEVGINLQLKVESYPLFLATVRSNQHDAAAWSGGTTMFSDVLLDPSNYTAFSTDTLWGVNWANWFNGISGNEEQSPSEIVRSSYFTYQRARASSSAAEQIRLMKNVLQVYGENFWTIGIALGPERYGIRRKNFMNVPEKMPAAWLYPDPAPTNPEQYFIAAVP